MNKKSALVIALVMLLLISCGTTPTPVVEPSSTPMARTEIPGNMTSTGFYWPTGTSNLGSYAGWLASGCDGATAYSMDYYHIGHDIAAELGYPVFAIADGIVIDISSNGWSPDTMPDIGNVGVLVQHWLSDGTPFIAIYGHVQTEAGVTYRSELSAGEKFAEIGPWSPPHLHFAISPGTIAQAPYGAVRCPEAGGLLDPNGYVNPIEWITTTWYPGAQPSLATATPPPAPCAVSLTSETASLDGLTITIDGSVTSDCSTITRLNWQWGDGVSNDQWFPASHTYATSGLYPLVIEAYNDQETAETFRLTAYVREGTGDVILVRNDEPEYWMLLGDMASSEGNYDSAIEYYLRSLEIRNNCTVRRVVGTLYAQQSQWNEAAAFLEASVVECANFEELWDMYRVLAITYANQDEVVQALETARISLDLAPAAQQPIIQQLIDQLLRMESPIEEEPGSGTP